jgi:hypothetical protein
MINWEGTSFDAIGTWLAGGVVMTISRILLGASKLCNVLTRSDTSRMWCYDGVQRSIRTPNELLPTTTNAFMAGKNKIQHVAHLRVMGYQFAILPGVSSSIPIANQSQKAGRMSRDRNCMPQWTSCIPNSQRTLY